jgi:hypothetical protein
MAHAGGRPTLYKEEYCQRVLDDMANGFSLTAFAGLIGTNRQTLSNWAGAHPEFLDAVTRAKAMQLRWWEERAHSVAQGNGGPGASSMTAFGLTNLGDGEWRNRQDHTFAGPGGGPIRYEEVKVHLVKSEKPKA